MSSTVFNYDPTIFVLEGLLEKGQNILEPNIFQKAVRIYLYLRVIYGNGITCGKINIKLPDNIKEIWLTQWFKWAEWREKITIVDIDTGNIVSSEEHLDILSDISIEQILFNNNLDSKKSWNKLFQTKFPNVDTKIIDKLLGTNQVLIYPFDRCEKVLKNSFKELAQGKKCWLEPKSDNKSKSKKFTGEYHTLSIIPEIDDGTSSKHLFRPKEEQAPEYIQNEDIQDLVSKFASSNDRKRLLFETEFAIKDSNQYNDIINELRINWFDRDRVYPTRIKYQKFFDSDVVEKIIYPVSWFYTQRAPYLYFISEENQKIVWDAYRIDRIKQLKIVAWNQQVPSILLEAYLNELLPSAEDIQDYLQADKALGYAFWKQKKWAIVRFNHSHYEKYVQATSRNEIWLNLEEENFSSLSKLLKNKTQKFNKVSGKEFPIAPNQIEYEQLASIEEVVTNTSNHEKYVFCLAKYYEGDSYVLQRLLAWGKQVKVLFPQELKNEVSEEIKATWEQYQD